MGPEHGCALLNGVAWCWGDNSFGKLGHPDAPNEGWNLARVSLGDTTSLLQATDVAVGHDHRCIVTRDRTLRCWGNGSFGKLGTSDKLARAGPTKVPGLGNVSQVAVNDSATCAVLDDGSLHCFGLQPWRADLKGCHERSEDDFPCSATPSLVTRGVSRVALGANHVCILTPDSRVLCSGKNDRGQLGTGDTKDRTSPTPVKTNAGKELTGVAKLRAFAFHTCALSAAGAVHCWGDNLPFTQGRKYNDSPVLTVATPLPALTDAVDVSDRCILSRRGELRCWGHVFPNDREFSYEPRRIGRCGVRAIGTGPGVCFVDELGTNCLGHDGFNAKALDLNSLSGSGSELCGIDSKGTLLCWRADEFNALSRVGSVPGSQLSWPEAEPGCASEGPLVALPRFPQVPPATVTAHDRGSAFEGEVAPRKDETGVRLSKRQIDELLVLLNDEENYTDMATCHHPRHEYVFRDSRGEAQATVGVSDDCATLDAWPEIPAQHRRGGNIVRPKLRRGMARLCNQLKLEGCPPPESFERQ